MEENTSSAGSQNEEIGVMEKGGRLQFVRATGNDIQSRSPTPTSSENETEATAARVEGEQESFQLDEAYSQGSDQFERESDQETAQKTESTIENHDTQVELPSEGSQKSPKGSKVQMIAAGSLEDTSVQESIKQASGLSVASQTDVDKLNQIDQQAIDDGETETKGKELAKDAMEDKEVSQKKIQEQISISNDIPEQTQETSPVQQPLVVENQTTEKRPKTSKLKKSPESSLFTSEMGDSEDRQKINDLAFMTWLKNKNKEQLKKRKQAFVVPSEEEKEEKRKMCEVAYKSWLMKKAKEDKEKLRTEKLQTDELVPERKCSAEITFDIWLQNKMKQRRREARRIEQQQQEQEQAARNVDREVSKEAYRRWMKKKREEKRDEISRRLLYRKLYFSQEQELRLSQSRRYAVQ